MSPTPIEERLRASLAAKAGSVRAPADLAPRVVEAAVRRHRRHVAGATAVAVTLIAALVALAVVSGLGRSTAPPAHRSAPASAARYTAAPNWDAQLRWFDRLGAGPDLTPPFPVVDASTATAEQLYDVGPVVRLVRDGAGARPGVPLATYVGRTRDSILVLASTRDSTELTRLLRIEMAASRTARPRVTVLADGVVGAALSPDLHEIAVGVMTSADRSAGLAVLDARSGRRLESYSDPDLIAERVVGWSGGRVVAARTSSTVTRVVAWVPGGSVDDLGTLPGGRTARLVSAAGRPGRLLVSSQGDAYETCGSVLALDDLSRTLAEGCYRPAPVSLAPDGRHALLSDFSIVELTAGRVVHSAAPDGVAVQDAVWEDDAHVVATLPWPSISYDSGPGWFSMLRCDAEHGGCERVRQPGDLGAAAVDVTLP